MDLEGSDGRERGEDDTSFERQSALFALAVADVLLINMWAKDVGRETGAGKPLLKTIFQVLRLQQLGAGLQRVCLKTQSGTCIWTQLLLISCVATVVRVQVEDYDSPLQVNLKLFTPDPGRRRTVLLFVFRDRTKTPLARLVETWGSDLERIWAAITKPSEYENTRVEDFFEVRRSAWTLNFLCSKGCLRAEHTGAVRSAMGAQALTKAR